MTYHPEYFPIMLETNISSDWKNQLFIQYRKRLLEIIDGTQYYEILLPQIQEIDTLNQLHVIVRELSKVDLWSVEVNNLIGEYRNDLYSEIIYPQQELKNNDIVYRVWTFMKYFISDNSSRFMSDSLVQKFDNYIYSDEKDITYDRFKKLGIEYILLDLNAATIDRDPARNLTRRYENLLEFTAYEKLELIETDSVCLKTAYETYKIDWNLEKYVLMSWVNYNWEYTSAQKRELCVVTIMEILRDKELLSNYPHLQIFQTAISQAEINFDNDTDLASAIVKLLRWNGYKALFKINQ